MHYEKTKELAGLHQKYQALARTALSTNALAMCLNSAVDAPLNTGIASYYRQIFFSPDYIARGLKWLNFVPSRYLAESSWRIL